MQEECSDYLMADDIARVREGMMIATGEEPWAVFGTMTVEELVEVLRECARNIRLSKYQRSRRGPKKPPIKRKYNKKHPHIATSRVLAERGMKK